MSSLDSDPRHRRLLTEMSDAELGEHIEFLRAELERLAELQQRDLAMLSSRGHPGRPFGKLRLRLARTKERWRACRARQKVVLSEVASRRGKKRSDWEEPTVTDLERLHKKLRTV
jgi:hypothetical protein